MVLFLTHSMRPVLSYQNQRHAKKLKNKTRPSIFYQYGQKNLQQNYSKLDPATFKNIIYIMMKGNLPQECKVGLAFKNQLI